MLGCAVASAISERGARIALIDSSWSVPANCPGETLVQGGVDLADPAKAGAAVQAVVDRFGALDVVLNIAGGFSWQKIEGGEPQTWADLYRMNVLTAANVSRAAVPHLKKSAAGRIVNVGSAAALKAGEGMGPYAASKSGVHALTQSLAEELKPSGVTVNAVLPSIIDTPANRADMPKADYGAWVTPKDLAAVILFLASEEAKAVTGALVPVTGRV